MVCDAEGALVVQQNHRDQKKQVEGQPDSGFDVHGDTSGNGQGGCRQGHGGVPFFLFRRFFYFIAVGIRQERGAVWQKMRFAGQGKVIAG